ncbi:uncharacterized protein ANIA_11667 [Aspergillus nidulans FGSC A4]|uniref:Uncharacterized protein n=1 Tax=Emericella nidulans (strain FGSC A4 / ATCC 38163 / CBS 112.46 / NRRL 194 / M139) TaxID=227321 RepID=C8V2Z8_EMENI|nr:hypothetical protein [Aspergillus nidulans FGSC A4]CBF71731.1 TPA: hypothetical protein ANIA_11667 [Aspergillus nidulans FGSC A4]
MTRKTGASSKRDPKGERKGGLILNLARLALLCLELGIRQCKTYQLVSENKTEGMTLGYANNNDDQENAGSDERELLWHARV